MTWLSYGRLISTAIVPQWCAVGVGFCVNCSFCEGVPLKDVGRRAVCSVPEGEIRARRRARRNPAAEVLLRVEEVYVEVGAGYRPRRQVS